jgi:HK97 family phage major capsid protein/HK97 family phage prohead protease
MKKLYSILTIKSMDEEKRIIRGIASTPKTDRVGDIVESKGAQYTLPMPLLWQHRSDEPIGHVIKVDVTDDGIEIEAQVQRYDEPGELKNLLDKAWGMIKTELVKGLSIGFRAIEQSDIKGTWGYRFTKWDWLELSVVTIPANSEASIQTIKSLFEMKAPVQKTAASGIVVKLPGVTGKTTKVNEMNIEEQIKSFEATRQAKAARMAEIMEKAGESGSTLDAQQTEEYDTLGAEVKSIDEHLNRLNELQKMNLSKAKPVNQVQTLKDGSEARSFVQVKNTQKLAPGIRLARVAKCIGIAKGNLPQAELIAKSVYQDDDATVAVLKAAVAAGTTSNTTWAGNLVGDETNVFADFIEFLRPQTIIGRFGSNGIPALRRVPFRVPLIGQTSGGAGYWVGEGKAKPLTKFDFSRTTLEPLKVANIAVVTEEVLRDSSPSAEFIVRDQLVAALRERMDLDFVDPAKALVSGVSPASITNGITTIGSVGNTADDIRTDLAELFAVFIADNNTPTTAVLIMSANTALRVSLLRNALGQKEFPDLTINGGMLDGIPVIVSEYVPSSSAGSYVFMVNAQDIYIGDDGGFMIDVSREASLEMSDAPTGSSAPDPTNPTATSLVSLWQTNAVGFRAERTINWKRRRDSAVAVLDDVNWGEASS